MHIYNCICEQCGAIYGRRYAPEYILKFDQQRRTMIFMILINTNCQKKGSIFKIIVYILNN